MSIRKIDSRYVYAIDWIDSCTVRGWQNPSRVDTTLATCRSAGFMLRRTRKQMTLVQSLGEGSVAEALTIPMACIKRVRRARVP